MGLTGGEQLAALATDLGKAGSRTRQQAALVVRRSALQLKNSARGYAPVDTGFLQSSILMRSSSDGLTAIISPTAHYAIFVEAGTIFMAAQPYMEPAVDTVTPAFEAAMQQVGVDIL